MNQKNTTVRRGFIGTATKFIQAAFCAASVAGAMLPALGAAAADAPPASLFPIGVYWQPTGSFDLWKSRGINTAIGFYTKPFDMEEFNNAAVSRGLWMIRNPRANPAADIN